MLQRILLIDDSADDALLIKRALFEAGFDDPLYHIADPREAISYLAGSGKHADRVIYPLPDVVFLDLKMPEVDGFEVLKWINTQPQLVRLIVIVVTAVQDLKLIQLAYQLGAHSFLSKDANTEEMRNVVQFLRNFSRISGVFPRQHGQESESPRARL